MENERSWDGHANIAGNHRQFAGETDIPIGALLTDLEQRGLLDSTLVVCTASSAACRSSQKGGTGRDHNPHAFTTWMAGGGVKGGAHYGETDEIGHKAAVNRVSINDLHATILHLLGIDHDELTYRFNGRDFRLTDVAGRWSRKFWPDPDTPRRVGIRGNCVMNTIDCASLRDVPLESISRGSCLAMPNEPVTISNQPADGAPGIGPPHDDKRLLRALGVTAATAIVVGNTIGTGIFLKPGTIAHVG